MSDAINANNYLNSFIGIETFKLPIDDSPELQNLIQHAEQAQDLPFENKLETVKNLAKNAMNNAWEARCISGEAFKKAKRSLDQTVQELRQAQAELATLEKLDADQNIPLASEGSSSGPRLPSLLQRAKPIELPGRIKTDPVVEKPAEKLKVDYSQQIANAQDKINKAKEKREKIYKQYIKKEKSFNKYNSIVFESHPLSTALKEKQGCCRYYAVLFLILGAAAKLGDKHYVQFTEAGNIYTCYNDLYNEREVKHISLFAETLSNPKLNYSTDPTIYEKPVTQFPKTKFLAYEVTPERDVRGYATDGHHFDFVKDE